ncbi:hypothetical protein ACSSZE_03420 [Acidithiobacillus caldus]
MKMVFMLYAMLVVVKLTVAITERPRSLFDALHESGEVREVAERSRMEASFFVEAVERVRRAAIVWMEWIAGGRHGVPKRYAPMESGLGRSVPQGNGSAPKGAIHYGLSLWRSSKTGRQIKLVTVFSECLA